MQNTLDCNQVLKAWSNHSIENGLTPTEPEVDSFCNLVAVDMFYFFGMHPKKKHLEHLGQVCKRMLPMAQ